MVASNRVLFVGALVAELGVVFYLSARVQKLTPNAATILFLLYAILNGVTLSVLTLTYSGSSIATAFAVTAGMFGVLAIFGSTTKRSLAGTGQFFYMGLIGLVLASLLRLFWHNDALEFLISVIGVFVFTGLTAWDAQRLKRMAAGPQAVDGSYAIMGALSLYLNFINLFLFMFRFQAHAGKVPYSKPAAVPSTPRRLMTRPRLMPDVVRSRSRFHAECFGKLVEEQRKPLQ
jgi:FtsH-binding integral membrane protein